MRTEEMTEVKNLLDHFLGPVIKFSISLLFTL